MIFKIISNEPVQEINGGTADVIAAFEVRGYPYLGPELSRFVRPELYGNPRFGGLVGPMWDGDSIRYETPEVYARLSR